ncbi:hypothetical protein EIN_258830 [Entamoeba invadens IP1]|uniref:Leucine rich repeat containing protein BspA family protein n=1 Tax=Entamoeba invadens IP1 TaxID=370355 RepID=A0A0A1TV45_ENTIV|nr:hypothetical protein EIN_258830 [Entamoeba invadens IP1]ELP84199.1 hypothetical protein EIN_258830 [Entamoeba invadens IP1]|eukprot:XP_004183545.1 hypothetical protein EIN_258830 [Entamoeba invadens IP1]
MSKKVIDAFNMMVVSKYFITIADFINLELVCKKFTGNMTRFHFNPISLTTSTRRFFPHLQTICLYTPDDEIFDDDEVEQRSVQYYVNYTTTKAQRNTKIHYPFIEFNSHDANTNDEIPEIVGRISNNTFCDKYISSCVIPSRVVTIGNSAFCGCGNLSCVTFPSHLKEINNKAFYHCFKLKSLELPICVSYIGEFAFEMCTSLREVTLPCYLEVVEACCFSICGSLSKVVFPSDLKKIEHNAFESCTQLKHLNFPESVNFIGERAFYLCVSLESINIPSNATCSLNCFQMCSKLANVQNLEAVKDLKMVFMGCPNIYNEQALLLEQGEAQRTQENYEKDIKKTKINCFIA